MNRKPLSKEEFDYFSKKMPRLTVEVVIIKDGGVVLSKRTIPPDKGYWHIPGGSVLVGETLEEAIKQVALDELGVKVEVKKFLRFFYYPDILRKTGYWPVGAGFLAEITDGELRTDGDSSEIRVFKSIPEKVVPGQRNFLEILERNGFKL